MDGWAGQRHTGHNIADVSKQLGHHYAKITVDTYYHCVPGSNRLEVDYLDGEKAPRLTLYAPTREGEKKGVSNLPNPL